MKNIILLCSKVIAILTLCSSCNAGQLGYSPLIQGSNKPIRNNIQIPNIKKLHLSGIAHIYIQQATYNELIVETEDNILPALKQDVKGDTLHINLTHHSIYPNYPITYILKIKELTSIKAYGDVKVICQEGLKLDTLLIAIYDRAFANIWFNGDKITAIVSNSANLIVGGNAKQQEITVNDFGKFDGKQLRGSTGVLDITYAGHGIINVQDELLLKIPGQGRAEYLGQPKINKKITSNANISKLQEANS